MSAGDDVSDQRVHRFQQRASRNQLGQTLSVGYFGSQACAMRAFLPKEVIKPPAPIAASLDPIEPPKLWPNGKAAN